MANKTIKISLLGLLLIMFMSVAMAAEVTQDTTTEVAIPSTETKYSSMEDNIVDNLDKEISNEKTSKNIVLNSNNFNQYVTDKRFNDNVSAGDTIDVQGKLDGSRFALEVDKPVNIISSTGDAYWNMNTTVIQGSGGYVNIFTVNKKAAGTNITDITFYNTQVRIENTSNIKVDNINLINEDKGIGNGVGAFTVREGSENISITNSYFKTRGNGGHSNVVFAAAYNCLFENNTIEGFGDHGIIGNLLYLTTYNVNIANPKTNINITIRNNVIRSYNADSYATCYGLALEGTGHIIENNIIDNAFPVMAQYADADYDFETNIDGIIFNNNTIVKSSAQLVFPGIVSNNTFNEETVLKQVHAYGNKFNKVTIQDNVKFENNTATSVTIIGDNNILNNNEIYSDDDYAVTITGENNTLSDNKIAGYLGRGENAISNSTEITSINNNEDISRVFYITDDNWGKYFDSDNDNYKVKNIFKSGDILIFNNEEYVNQKIFDRDKVLSADLNLTFINNRNSINFGVKIIAINNTFYEFSQSTLGSAKATIVSVINSTLYKTGKAPLEVINSNIYMYERTAQYPKDNSYWMDYYYGAVGDLPADVTLYVINYAISSDLVFDKPIHMEALPYVGNLNSNITLIEGSEGSTFTDITFKGKVVVNDNNIIFTNCTFNEDVEITGSYVTFEDSIFNSAINLNSTTGIIFNNNNIIGDNSLVINNSKLMIIENNSITTTADNTIIFDEQSSSSTVKNNVLKASSLIGDDSVIVGDNDVFDNTPSYNTSIIIESDDLLFSNDVSTVNITVNNINTETPVDKGYVEVYLDGVLQGIKTLTDGKVSVEVNTNQSSIGDVPLKVWYYDGIRYANNVTVKTVNVAKSNVTMSVDEFTAKLNEKANTKITFTNQKGNPVDDTNVTVTVGRTTYTVETVDGVATLDEVVTTEWLDTGRMTITFPDTELYNRNTTTITLNTSKADAVITPTVTVEDNTASISLVLTDDYNNNVTDGKVTITTLGGDKLGESRVRNGLVETSVTLPDDYSDEYLVANFTGSYYYNDMARNIKITTVLNSTITLETNSPLVGEELIINGKLTDSKNNPISKENITLDLNGTKVQLTTDEDGNYNYSYVPALGTSTITVTFNGNPDTYGTSASKDVTIRDTDREMNEVLDRLDELQKENEKLQEQLDNITGQNNVTQDQLNNLTQQNKDLQDQIAALTEMIAALTSAENTTIVFDSLGTVKYNDVVTISGVVSVESGASLSNQFVTLTFNDESVDVKVVNGVFEYNVTVKDIGEQVVTAVYAGNSKYQSSSNSTSFYVQKKPVLYFYKVENTTEDNTVTVSGKLLNNGKAIKGATITLNVNGKDVTVTPNKDGYFKYSFKAIAGENIVTASYAGTTEYAEANATTSVYALMKTTLYAYKIENANTQDSIKVSGKLLNKGKAVVGETVTINVNGKTYTATTNKDGYFQVNIKLAAVGENNLTVSYAGSDVYVAAEYNSTFVTKAKTNVYAYSIADSVVGKTVKVNGKLLTGSTPCSDREVLINVDGEIFKVKTNFEGYYQYDLKQVSMGTHNVTVSFAGDDEYLSSTFNTSFIAKSE